MKPFLREKTTWSSAFMDAGVDRVHARIRAKDPSTPRRRKDFNGKPREFIEVIVKDPAHPEEAFSNIGIDTDGEVARVWFDYSFMVGNYKQDSGKDAWHLLRTDAGRKIASVVWSMDSNPAPPPPNARR